MTSNPHFETAKSWKVARQMVVFLPVEPAYTAGRRLQALRIHVRDHKLRELAAQDRTLEAHYGDFVLTQVQKGDSEAQRHALAVSYGQEARDVQIAGHAGRAYERGPEPPPDDIDGRSPAVVTWHDGAMHYFIASEELDSGELIRIAESMYPVGESNYLKDKSARAYSRRKRRI